MKRSFWGIIILAIIIVFFSVQNAAAVDFKFLFGTIHVSLALLLIITFILGLIIGAAYFAIAGKKRKDIDIDISTDMSISEDSDNDE